MSEGPFDATADPVCAREDDEDAWLAARRGMVTASESAHLLGLLKDKPWGLSPQELAERKADTRPYKVGKLAHAGRWWEGPDLEWVAFVTGIDITPSSLLYRSRARPFMGATPDGRAALGGRPPDDDTLGFLTVCDDFDSWTGAEAAEILRDRVGSAEGPVVAESKHQESRRRSRWSKPGRPPKEYVSQLRHQMCVVEAPLGLLVAKVDANELYVHVYEREPAIEQLLVQACEDFAERYL